MAVGEVAYCRNHDVSDTTWLSPALMANVSAPTISDTGWDAPSGYQFEEWNTSQDGTGISLQPGATPQSVGINNGYVYAIWKRIPTPYLVTDVELENVANAIRTKGGTSASLTYPTGFVSAIDAISTAPTLQNKTAYPGVSSRIVNPDSGYDGLSRVTIDAIPSPTCNVSAVSNHSVTVTPKITDHYSSQGNGSPVTISASDLVSGTLTITENGTVDVTNYASALVGVDSGGGVETAHIYANLSTGGNAYYTDANGNVGTEAVNYDTGMVEVNDYAPVGSLVVFYAIPMPMASPTGMTYVGRISSQKMNLAYVYQVTT